MGSDYLAWTLADFSGYIAAYQGERMGEMVQRLVVREADWVGIGIVVRKAEGSAI